MLRPAASDQCRDTWMGSTNGVGKLPGDSAEARSFCRGWTAGSRLQRREGWVFEGTLDSPGPLAPPCNRRPSRKMTARSYSCTILMHRHSENGNVAPITSIEKTVRIFVQYPVLFEAGKHREEGRKRER